MKVIFITREGKDSPGSRIRCYQTASLLKQQGISAKVLSTADDFNMPEGENEHLISFPQKVFCNIKLFSLLLIKHRRTIVIINRINYHTPAPFIFCLLTRNKMILDIDDWEMNPKLPTGLKKFIKSFALTLTLLVAKKSVFCIAASTYLYRFIKKINPNTIKIPSSVVDENIPNKTTKETSSINLCWTGTLHKESNISELKTVITCFNEIQEEIPNIELTIIAKGKYLEKLKSNINSNKKIILHQNIPSKNVLHLLAKSDIGLLPLFTKSKFNLCKSPVKLFEYMNASLTVVAIKNIESKKIITHMENGLLAKDIPEFQLCLKEAILDKNLRKKTGNAAKKTMTETYNPVIYTQQLIEKLKTI